MQITQTNQESALQLAMSLQKMRTAQASYAKWTAQQKAEALLGISWTLEHRSQEFALVEAAGSGFGIDFLVTQEFQASARFFREQAGILLSDKNDFKTQYVPLGLVGIIAPKCLGLRFVCQQLALALAAGNAVLIKISSARPEVAQILKDVFHESGFPDGLVEIFSGSGSEIGQAIVGHPSVHSISAAASSSVAKSIAQKCAQSNKKFFIESSSKNVLALVEGWQAQDFSEVMKSVSSGWGQTGFCTNKIFVLEAHYVEFKEKLKNWLDTLEDIRLLNDEKSWQQVEAAFLKIKEEHGKALLEWKKGKPLFVEDLPNCSLFQQENENLPIFIVNVIKYSHEVQKWTDNQDTGFKFVVRGQVEKALGLAQKVRFGSIEINSWLNPEADQHVGLKNSFYGLPLRSAKSQRFCDVKSLAALTVVK